MSLQSPGIMEVTCPHCDAELTISEEDLGEATSPESFDCPSCSGIIQWPEVSSDAVAPMAADISHDSEDFQSATFTDARYEIRRLIGRGGMGSVYEGLDTRLSRKVAIKVLPSKSLDDDDAQKRFEREAKTMAALVHPNIVQIYDYGQTKEGNPYLVMEYVEGMDLHNLRKAEQLQVSNALEIVAQVCSALDFAHARGFVHRDIKPPNILMSTDGVAKVADFGLAKLLDGEMVSQFQPGITSTGAAMGTPEYMAPEQFAGESVDHRADIYSLGVMLYDLLTGSPPRGAWQAPSEFIQVDIRLDEIVIRALQQNPTIRYQSTTDFLTDLDFVRSSTGGISIPPGTQVDPLPSSIVGTATKSSGSQFSAPGSVRQPIGNHTTTSIQPATSKKRTVIIAAISALVAIIAAVSITHAISNKGNQGGNLASNNQANTDQPKNIEEPPNHIPPTPPNPGRKHEPLTPVRDHIIDNRPIGGKKDNKRPFFNKLPNLAELINNTPWAAHEVPEPDPNGWIVLFDGKQLNACRWLSPVAVKELNKKITYQDGILSIEDLKVMYSHAAKDVELQATLKPSVGRVVLAVRQAPNGNTYAGYHHAGMNDSGIFGIGMSTGSNHVELEQIPDKGPKDQFFTMRVSIKGDLIELMVDNKVILKTHNSRLTHPGTIGLRVFEGKVEFKDIRVRVLDENRSLE